MFKVEIFLLFLISSQNHSYWKTTSSQQIPYELRSIEIVPSDKGNHGTPLSLRKLIVYKQISKVAGQ